MRLLQGAACILLVAFVSCEVEEDEFSDIVPDQVSQQQRDAPAISVKDVTDPHLADNILVRFCTS
jgi:hypothetical protein